MRRFHACQLILIAVAAGFVPGGCSPTPLTSSQTGGLVAGGLSEQLDETGDADDATAGEGNATPTDATPSQGGPAGDAGGHSTGDPASGDSAKLQVFPPDNPWNQDISNLPVHPNSAAYINSIGSDRALHPDFGTVWEGAPIGIPYVVVSPDTPKVAVDFLYADESDAGPYPIPDSPPIEGGPDSSGDRHILMVDPANMKLYELFAAYPPGDDAHGLGAAGWSAGSGAIFDLTKNDLRPAGWTSADAAGLPIFPGLVRYDEVVEQGEITHALRFTVRRTQRAYIPPATHFASSSTDPALPPMGLRVRLKADFDISGYTPNVQVILRAMKRYGMFVADNGSDWYISGAPDTRWDDDELRQLKQLRGRHFEAVYTGDAVTP